MSYCNILLSAFNGEMWYETIFMQKQPQEVFFKKDVLQSLAKFTGKHLCQSLFFQKVAEMRLWLRCFPVSFAKFSRTLFFTEHNHASPSVHEKTIGNFLNQPSSFLI